MEQFMYGLEQLKTAVTLDSSYKRKKGYLEST